MIRTYIVELKNSLGHDVLEYYHTLKSAKLHLINLANSGTVNGVSILCIHGYSFGEGFHQYRMVIVKGRNGNKFKRIKYRLSEV